MRKPIFVYQLVLSVLLASCTKAEFVKISDARAPYGSGGSRADATSLALQCEDKANTICVQPYPNTSVTVACPDLCHTTAGQPAGTGVVCQPGTASDNCDKDNVCLATVNGGTTSICFRLCTHASDCAGGMACAARFMSKDTWVKVCDLKYDSCSTGSCCDPLNPDSGKCGSNVCYLVAPLNPSSQDSRTVCEYANGSGTADDICGSSRDCVPRFACYFPPTSPETGTCRPVCDPQAPSRCPTCTAYNNQYGVCL